MTEHTDSDVDTVPLGGASVTPALSATGDSIGVGEAARVTVSAESVDRVAVGRLWVDWTVAPVQTDGATFTDEVTTEGRCRFDWDTVQSSVDVAVDVEPAVRYIGGTYAVTATGSDPDGSATTAVTLDVEPPGTHDYAVETLGSGLERPWAIAFLPNDSRMLVTERPGRLSVLDRADGSVQTVAGTPTVDSNGQGGMLDVAVDPRYPTEPWVYLTYSAANADGDTATHLGRGELDPAVPELRNFEVLNVAEPFAGSSIHYGSRIAFPGDGTLLMTSGDRRVGGTDFGPDHVSQDTGNELGAVLRLTLDGSVPLDNPFVDVSGADGALFSYGHRNPQGLTVHPDTGTIWQSGHSEKDGDEINAVRGGENYGWPVATEACRYGTDDLIGDRHDERDDVVSPAHVWPCGTGGFPPGGVTVYEGDVFPNWAGDLFVSGLAKRYLARFVVDDGDAVELESLLADRDWRIRDVEVAPDDGYLYVVPDISDAPIVRLVPP